MKKKFFFPTHVRILDRRKPVKMDENQQRRPMIHLKPVITAIMTLLMSILDEEDQVIFQSFQHILTFRNKFKAKKKFLQKIKLTKRKVHDGQIVKRPRPKPSVDGPAPLKSVFFIFSSHFLSLILNF